MSFEKDYLRAAQGAVTGVLDAIRPDLLAAYGRKDHTVKRDNTVVTEWDHKIETQLRESLAAFDDSIPFVGEESGLKEVGDTFWLVDPIDGTEHFVRGLPFCSTMVTLIAQHEPVLSIIDMFASNERYTAIKGNGAYCNGEALQVSDVPMKRAVLEFETHADDPANLEKWASVRDEIYGFFNFLASGFGHSSVAAGKMEGRVALNGYGYTWDFAPGALLVQEAGGKVANIGSDTYDYRNLSFIAANPDVHDRLQELLANS